jgi:NAD(P)-dependent dehydrogenase (short-subunit alcohol dehydrogenase family)
MNIELPKIENYFNLTGKTALITGATGSLGSIAAQALAGAGARMVLAGGNKDKLDEIVKHVNDAGGNAVGINVRPDSETNVDKIVADTVAAAGSLDILVVASGFNTPGTTLETPVSTWDNVMDANVRQTWLICKAAGRQMVQQDKGGKMILISSTRARIAADNCSAYCTSKAATNMLVQCFSAEWGSSGINVNALAPTVFRSELTAWLFEEEGPGAEVRKEVLKRIPIGRLGEPEDFIGGLIFLSSKASDYTAVLLRVQSYISAFGISF